MAQGAIVVPNESGVGQLLGTQLAAEALRMPASLHRLNDTPNYNVATLVAERCIQDSKILLAVLASLELVEDSILERAEALGAPTNNQFQPLFMIILISNLHKTLDVPQLPVRVDNLLLGFEALIAPSARHRFQAHVGARWNSKMITMINIDPDSLSSSVSGKSLACKKN